MNAIKESKNALRKHMKTILKTLSEEDKSHQSTIVTKKLLKSDIYRKSKRISVYLSMTDEINTDAIVRECFKEMKHCYIPRYDSKSRLMEMVRLRNLEDYDSLPLTTWNIKQPAMEEEREDALHTGGVDLVLVPGLAFSPQGHRLGRGKGYYDTFLAKVPSAKLVALAFSQQVVEEVPCDANDVKVHKVVTPSSQKNF